MIFSKQFLLKYLKDNENDKLEKLLDNLPNYELSGIINSLSYQEKLLALQNPLIIKKLDEYELKEIISSFEEEDKVHILSHEEVIDKFYDNPLYDFISTLKEENKILVLHQNEVVKKLGGFYLKRIISNFNEENKFIALNLEGIIEEFRDDHLIEIMQSLLDEHVIQLLNKKETLDKLSDFQLRDIVLNLSDFNKLVALTQTKIISKLSEYSVREITSHTNEGDLKKLLLSDFYIKDLKLLNLAVDQLNDEEFINFIIDRKVYEKYNSEFLYDKITSRDYQIKFEIWNHLLPEISKDNVLDFSYENIIKELMETEDFNSGKFIIYYYMINPNCSYDEINKVLSGYEEELLLSKLIKHIDDYPKFLVAGILYHISIDSLKKVIFNKDIFSKIPAKTLFGILLSHPQNNYELFSNPLIYKKILENYEEIGMSITDIFANYSDVEILKILVIERNFRVLSSSELNSILKNINYTKVLIFFNAEILNRLEADDIVELAVSAYNEETIGNIPKALVERLASSKLSKIFKCKLKDNIDSYNKLFLSLKLPFEKTVFMLDELSFITESEKLNILNNLFPSVNHENKNIKELKEIIIKNCEDILRNLKKTDYISENYLTRDMMEHLDNSVLLEKISRNLFSTDNYDREIDKDFFTIYLNMLAREECRNRCLDVNIEFLSIEGNINGTCSKHKKSVFISSEHITNRMDSNLARIATIFHELTHAQQDKKLKDGEINYGNLKFAKDIILGNNCSSYSSRNQNYHNSSIESNARCLASVSLYRFIGRYSSTIQEKFYIQTKEKYQSNYKASFDVMRKHKDRKINLHDLFDMIIDPITISLYIRDYPILLMEYDKNGVKKPLEDIRKDAERVTSVLLNLDHGPIEYKKLLMEKAQFYQEYLRDKDCIGFDDDEEQVISL